MLSVRYKKKLSQAKIKSFWWMILGPYICLCQSFDLLWSFKNNYERLFFKRTFISGEIIFADDSALGK
jgi:hypothetical protein